METIREILAQNIKKLRKARGWTQTDLAIEAGISFRGIQDIEVGKRNPRTETLQAIAGALGVTESEIMGTKPIPAPIAPLTTKQLAEAIQSAQLSEQEKQLLSLFRNSSTEMKVTIMKTLSNLIERK